MSKMMSYQHGIPKVPMDGRLWYQLLEDRAKKYPDIETMIAYDLAMRRTSMTYKQFNDWSMYLAVSFLEMGISRGQFVVLIGPTSIELAVFIMALHRLGTNTILMGPGELTAHKVQVIKSLDCRMIAYDPKMSNSQVSQLMNGIQELVQYNTDTKKDPQIIVSLENTIDQEINNSNCHLYKSLIERGQMLNTNKLEKAQDEVQIDDPILALFTSGSTGDPKIVQHTMHTCVNYCAGPPYTLPDLPRQINYLDRPLTWSFGYGYFFATVMRNATIVYVATEMGTSDTKYEGVFEILEKEKCAWFWINPLLIQRLLSGNLQEKYDLSHIEVFALVGQRYSLEWVTSILNRFPNAKVALDYGTTEAMNIAIEMMDKDFVDKGLYGKMTLYQGVEVKVVDDNGKIVPRGTRGEICVRHCTVFLEYLKNPEATSEGKSATGWNYTGDIGLMDEQGRIEVLGRKKQTIKRLLHRHFPAEIEKVISLHPSVESVVVVGVPDKLLFQEICACVILRQDDSRDEESSLKELENWCKDQWLLQEDGLSLKPRYFLAMKSFPLLSSGKTSDKEILAEAIQRLGLTDK